MLGGEAEERNIPRYIKTDADLHDYLKGCESVEPGSPLYKPAGEYLSLRNFQVEPLAPPVIVFLIQHVCNAATAESVGANNVEITCAIKEEPLKEIHSRLNNCGYSLISVAPADIPSTFAPGLTIEFTPTPSMYEQYDKMQAAVTNPEAAIYRWVEQLQDKYNRSNKKDKSHCDTRDEPKVDTDVINEAIEETGGLHVENKSIPGTQAHIKSLGGVHVEHRGGKQ